MRKLALVLSLVLLSGVVAAQQASYTYIDQKAPYKNPSPPILTALNLPKVGTSFQVQVPAGWSSGFASASYWLGFGVSNPNAPFPLWMGFLYNSRMEIGTKNPELTFREIMKRTERLIRVRSS